MYHIIEIKSIMIQTIQAILANHRQITLANNSVCKQTSPYAGNVIDMQSYIEPEHS